MHIACLFYLIIIHLTEPEIFFSDKKFPYLLEANSVELCSALVTTAHENLPDQHLSLSTLLPLRQK